MLDAGFYRAAGFFVQHGFLTAGECESLRGEIGRAQRMPAGVMNGARRSVDVEYRRASSVEVSPPSRALIDERLATVQAALSDHFRVALLGWQPAQFLLY